MIGAEDLLGIAAALMAAACYDTGYALQAIDARRAPRALAMRLGLLGHLARRPLWVGATALSLVGWPLQILALAHLPLTLVQPLLALGLILLLGLGSRILGEPVGAREWLAVGMIIVAVAIVAVAGPGEVGRVPRDAALFVVLGFLVAAVAVPLIVRTRGLPPVWLLVASAGAADAFAAFVAKLIAEDVSGGVWVAALLFAAAVGVVIGIGFLSESTALQRAPATRVAPAVLSLQVAVPVTLAPLIGGEGWGSTPGGGTVLAFALATLVLGVALLGSSPTVAAIIAVEPEPGGREPGGRGGGPLRPPSGVSRMNRRGRPGRPSGRG